MTANLHSYTKVQ